MGRSVSVPRNSVHVEYSTFEWEDSWDFNDELDYLQQRLCDAFNSLDKTSKWLGNEDHSIASNSYAHFGVSEYNGLVSIWCVPKDAYGHENAGWEGLRDHWIAMIGAKFTEIARSSFGTALVCTGRLSNGEAMFMPVEGKPEGALGLGFSSKEGWL